MNSNLLQIHRKVTVNYMTSLNANIFSLFFLSCLKVVAVALGRINKCQADHESQLIKSQVINDTDITAVSVFRGSSITYTSRHYLLANPFTLILVSQAWNLCR